MHMQHNRLVCEKCAYLIRAANVIKCPFWFDQKQAADKQHATAHAGRKRQLAAQPVIHSLFQRRQAAL